MIRNIIRLVACGIVVGAVSASAEDLPEGMVSVHYAFQIDGWRAVSGQSFCVGHKECQIGLDVDPVKLILRLGWQPGIDRLDISCLKTATDCQFESYTSTLDFSHRRAIEVIKVYETERYGNGFSSRYRIGTVLLHYVRDQVGDKAKSKPYHRAH